MTFNKTAILAIAAAVILSASAIGLAYAYSASTANIDNDAPSAFLAIYQDNNEATEANNYKSSFDDNTLVFDSKIGYLDTNYEFVDDPTQGTFGKKLIVSDVISQTDGTSVDDAKKYLHVDGETLSIEDTESTGDKTIYLLGSETLNIDVVNLSKLPAMTMSINATGLDATHAGAGSIAANTAYSYYVQWVGTTGYGDTKVVKLDVDTTGQTIDASKASVDINFDALASVNAAAHATDANDFDIVGTIAIWVVADLGVVDLSVEAAPAVLDNSMFTISLAETTA